MRAERATCGRACGARRCEPRAKPRASHGPRSRVRLACRSPAAECLAFCSNDYLGLADHPLVVEAMIAANAQVGRRQRRIAPDQRAHARASRARRGTRGLRGPSARGAVFDRLHGEPGGGGRAGRPRRRRTRGQAQPRIPARCRPCDRRAFHPLRPRRRRGSARQAGAPAGTHAAGAPAGTDRRCVQHGW